MMRKHILALILLSGLSSCVSFNTGAKLDSIGKAEPTRDCLYDGQYYQLDGVAYHEIKVEYKQLNPNIIGYFCGHDIDTCQCSTPAPQYLNAPEAEIYLVRLDPSRTDKPTFIRAADFDYTHAKRVKKEELNTPYIPKSYFKHGDFTTLMPSQYEGADVLHELPTIRSTGNKIRLPLAVAMSYGVDVPLTIAGYTISPLVHLFLMPFEE